jgi:hypothetical protein
MQRLALILVILLLVVPAFAQERQQAPSQADIALQQLQTELNALEMQRMTVTVLQLQLTKELNAWRQMEAVFCDKYGLNVDKWRKGLYRFDPQENKFVEVEPTAAEPATR